MSECKGRYQADASMMQKPSISPLSAKSPAARLSGISMRRGSLPGNVQSEVAGQDAYRGILRSRKEELRSSSMSALPLQKEQTADQDVHARFSHNHFMALGPHKVPQHHAEDPVQETRRTILAALPSWREAHMGEVRSIRTAHHTSSCRFQSLADMWKIIQYMSTCK